MSNGRWVKSVTGGEETSIDVWNHAWEQAMHFIGDPFATLASANANDESFAMGSVFVGAYRILGGGQPGGAAVREDLERATSRATGEHEHAHVRALQHMVNGNFTKAGMQWDEIAAIHQDFAAVRFAHDAYLHVGDDARRLRSSRRAFDSWGADQRGWGFVAGQLSFALEEAGFYDEAEDLGTRALALDPLDLWARHGLAHVYETREDNDAAFKLLKDDLDIWSAQDGLAIHIWWHLALRLIAIGAYEEALAIHDAQIELSHTPFSLADMASLLRRLEFVSVDVGDRWEVLADRYAQRPEWHTSAFLDLHMAVTFSRCPDHSASSRFFEGVRPSHLGGQATKTGAPDVADNAVLSENDHIFNSVVAPLAAAFRQGTTNPSAAVRALDQISDQQHLVGGSIAQRDLIGLTRSHFESQS